MKKVNFRIVAVGAMSSLLIMGAVSCKKSSTKKSNTELLTQATWKLVKDESKTGTGAWVDNTAGYAACEKDDNLIFRANATMEINEGATKCAPSDPQIIATGTWAFATNETQLKTTQGGVTETANIEFMDDTFLVASTTYTFGGVTYTERYTYGH
jgi:hypothetical protein